MSLLACAFCPGTIFVATGVGCLLLEAFVGVGVWLAQAAFVVAGALLGIRVHLCPSGRWLLVPGSMVVVVGVLWPLSLGAMFFDVRALCGRGS